MNERFHKAQKRLYEEIDIVKLIENMRFARFSATTIFEPHHYNMVSQFDKYCVYNDSEPSDSSESSCDEGIHTLDETKLA